VKDKSIKPAGGNNMKTPIREFYEEAVFKAWQAYNTEIIQVTRNFNDAIELGRAERNDKTLKRRNTAEIQAHEKLEANLKSLYEKYLATGEKGRELIAVFVYAIRTGPCVYIPQTDSGAYMKAKISERNPHSCYVRVENVIKPTGLYSFKAHHGYLVLVTEGDPIESQLFTLSPRERVKEQLSL